MINCGGIYLENKSFTFLSNNALKIIAMITMTFDHVGLVLLPEYPILRIIGRISFPIYAYLLAEGCKYTKNKRKHFLQVFLLGIACQAVYFLIDHSFYFNILLTFSVSIPIIYLMEAAKKDNKKIIYLLSAILIACVICDIIPRILPAYGIRFNYGFIGVMLPVLIAISDNRFFKLLYMIIGLLCLFIDLGGNQIYALLSLFPIIFYNGERGKLNIKGLAYFYYPVHLVIIYVISLF